MSVFEAPDGYLMFSYGWTLDSTGGAVQIAKFDLEGNFQWDKEHRRQRDAQPGIVDPIAPISGGRFVGAMTEFGGTLPKVTYLYWWNSEGDTIRTRFLKSDSGIVNGNHGTRQLLALADGGFLHCGWCSVPLNTACVTRLDSSGTILWERVYPQAMYILNATETPDGGFVLGGVRNNQLDRAVVIRTDSAGAMQWVRYYGAYAPTSGGRALVEADGSVLLAAAWQPTQPVPGSTDDQWASLYKYSGQGTFQWRKDYFWSYIASARYILPKANDHYWLVGGMYQYGVDPDYVTTLWELDENLDSLWMRRYYYYEPDDAKSFVRCVRSTSDGGLVMCGGTRQGITDPMPYLQSNWLIKLDAFGCLVPGCQSVGVQEFALGVNQYLHVAPNPVAQGQPVQLRFEPPQNFSAKGPLQVTVLDATGRMVQQERLVASAPAASATLALTLPASGLYYLHLADDTRWLAGAKVVVE